MYSPEPKNSKLFSMTEIFTMTDVFEINDNLLAALHLRAVGEKGGHRVYDLQSMAADGSLQTMAADGSLQTMAADGSWQTLEALEKGTALPVHRHLETPETIVCLEGSLDIIFYDLRPNDDCGGPFMGDYGTVIAEGMETNLFERLRVRLCPREGKYGVQVPPGAWHSVQVHEPSTVFLVKDKRPEP